MVLMMLMKLVMKIPSLMCSTFKTQYKSGKGWGEIGARTGDLMYETIHPVRFLILWPVPGPGHSIFSERILISVHIRLLDLSFEAFNLKSSWEKIIILFYSGTLIKSVINLQIPARLPLPASSSQSSVVWALSSRLFSAQTLFLLNNSRTYLYNDLLI